MKNLLIKELRLSASPLSYIFLTAALMTMLPGYPILMSAFFICFGNFHTFQNAREANDTLYSVLLPVSKNDIVRARFVFIIVIQSAGFLLCAALTALRMTVLSDTKPYTGNSLMNATPVYLAFVLLIYCAFNILFAAGFYKTAYKIGIPFIRFGSAVFILVAAAEILPHLPGLTFLHSPKGERQGVQFAALAAAAVVYCVFTAAACRISQKRFEKIDL